MNLDLWHVWDMEARQKFSQVIPVHSEASGLPVWSLRALAKVTSIYVFLSTVSSQPMWNDGTEPLREGANHL